jgi:hypothetical protein
MACAKSLFAAVGATLAAAACTGSRPPDELSGLWSAGEAACAAGVGVRFRPAAIEAVYEDEAETLFRRPRYDVEEHGRGFRVRITYELPMAANATGAVGGRGVLILARRPDGGVAPLSHTLIDGRTGAARQRIQNDPALTALTLQPCGDQRWRDDDLRGRSTAAAPTQAGAAAM